MTIAKKVEVRDFWYSLQDLVGGVLPESKRVELEKLIGQVEEEAKKEERDFQLKFHETVVTRNYDNSLPEEEIEALEELRKRFKS